MKRKLAATILTAVLAASLLTGCGKTGPKSGATDDQTSADQTTSDKASDEKSEDKNSNASNEDHGTLKVSFLPGNIRIAVNILALEKGYFEEEGVTVEPVNISGQEALTAIDGDGDQVDILNVGFVPDLQAIGSGLDITVIGGTAVEGGAIIAKTGNEAAYQSGDTKINIDAITNAKLGFVRNESSWVVTRQYLLDNGVSEDVIAKIEDESSGNISYYADETAVAQAVQKGEVEVGFLPMEYALLYGDAYDLSVVAAAGDLQENYVCCREVTSSKRLAEKYDSFVAYEKARIRAFEYYKQGETDDTVKKDVISTVSQYSGKEADYVETYLYGGITKYATDPNKEGIVKYVEAASNSGLLDSAGVDFSSYDITKNIDTSAYEEAVTELVEENPEDEFYQDLLKQYQDDNAK